eukprot:m.341289 g.341289  ORF g.341289 m.341289 type:complete len:413 (-) comp19984_c0_seq1:38-1276(-)
MSFLYQVQDALTSRWMIFGAGCVAFGLGLSWHRKWVLQQAALNIGVNSGPQKEQEAKDLRDLLYSIADGQARKEGYVHRGITCNVCKVGPIRGLRYKCANCTDYDVCEACEAVDDHNRTHVFVQIKIPIPPLANPRAILFRPFYPGSKENTGSLPLSTIRALQETTHFDQVELAALYEQFKSLSTVPTEEGGIDQRTFDKCLGPLGTVKNLVTERMFKFFDRDEDGVINFTDLVSGLSVLCKGTQEEKIEYAFKGYDLHNNGYLSRDELRNMFQAYFHLSMELIRDLVKALEEQLMANFNDGGDNPVSAVFTAPIPNSNGEVPHGKPSSIYESYNFETGLPGQYSAALSQTRAELGPSLQALSDKAIEDMVQAAFDSADLDCDGRLSFEEFKRWAMSDTAMIAWFDSLGSVF